MSYLDIVKEIVGNTDVKKDEVFYYSETPLEKQCEEIFRFSQDYLNNKNGLGKFSIHPARFFINTCKKVNGWAWANSGYFLISFNIGTIYTLKTKFLDNENIISDNEKFQDYQELNNSLLKNGNSVMELMYHTSLMFLLYHETGHLIQKSEKLKDVIYETVNEDEDFQIYNHLIEVDSDMFAAINLGVHSVEIWNNLENNFKTKENLIKIIAIIVCGISIYRLFYLLKNGELYFKKHSHPHIAIRCIIIIKAIIDNALIKLQKIGDTTVQHIEFKDLANSSFDLIESITEEVFEEDVFNSFLKTLHNNFGNINEYVKELASLVSKDKKMATSKRNKL